MVGKDITEEGERLGARQGQVSGNHPTHLALSVPTAIDNGSTHLDLSVTTVPLLAQNGDEHDEGEATGFESRMARM